MYIEEGASCVLNISCLSTPHVANAGQACTKHHLPGSHCSNEKKQLEVAQFSHKHEGIRTACRSANHGE
jgi:hypothetical protein